MMDLSHLNEQVDGYPSFVRWSADTGTELNWWAPERSGDSDLDYQTGRDHFRSLIAVLTGVYGPTRDFGLSFFKPGSIDPRVALSNVVFAMTACGCGPIETGFLDAFAEKAFVGRLSTRPHTEDWTRRGAEIAAALFDLARMARTPEIIAVDLIHTVDHMPDVEIANGVVWAISGAALAGAQH